MEISHHTSTAAPIRSTSVGTGAAAPTAALKPALLVATQAVTRPTTLGTVGAVNEAHIGTLKDGKTPPAGFDRTLKPYDTVMLPYDVTDEKQVRHTA